MNSKEIKNKARQSLKKHYLVFMIVCLVAGLLGVSYSSSLSILNSEKGAEESVSETNYDDTSTFDGLVKTVVSDFLMALWATPIYNIKGISDPKEFLVKTISENNVDKIVEDIVLFTTID